MSDLYLVTRWGNDESDEGPDGEDTTFLVKASSVNNASEIVDEILENMPHTRVSSFCHRITKIGVTISSNKTPIVLGPFVGSSLMEDDEGIDNSERWARDEKDMDWVSFVDYYDD